MKKFTALSAIVLGLAVLPALAATTTVEFAAVDGTKTVIVFNDADNTAVMNGAAPVAYTSDEAAKKICATVDGKENCATFDNWGTKVGDSSAYTTTAGSSGTATITAVAE